MNKKVNIICNQSVEEAHVDICSMYPLTLCRELLVYNRKRSKAMTIDIACHGVTSYDIKVCM